jgi:hypothetical protein
MATSLFAFVVQFVGTCEGDRSLCKLTQFATKTDEGAAANESIMTQ